MKTRKNSKLLILVLSLALLIGSVFAITASAAEAETGDLYAVTINHNDKISVAFIVKATQAEITDGTVAVKYTWEGGEEQTAVYHSNYSEPGYVYVVTNGVAAYELGKTLTFTVYTNGVAGETGTYSVANFLYNKLYRDGATGAKKDVYETLLAYGAASQVYFDKDASNLVTEFDYAYTNNANVKFENGRNSIFGSTATATYSGTGNVEAWVINGEEIASTATTYEVTVDGVVSVDIKVQCVHADVNPKDHNCDYCGANEFGTCEDADKNHKCDYCGATLSECADTDNNHNCDLCGTKLSDCVDAGKDHVCDICGGNVGGECADGNNDHNCDYCGEKLTDCKNENDDHYCDICGTKLPCVDGNNDHKCDICGEGSDCQDANSDYRCDACGVYSFNTNMTDGEHGMIIYQGQSNNYKTNADTVIYSNQVTGADRPDGYGYGAYYSIANDPTGIANKVLQVNMPARVNEGGQYMSSHVRFTPDGEGDILVFDYDMYLSSENTQGVDGLYIYLVDDTVFNYDPKQGDAEPDNQDGQGYQKIIIQTTSHSSGETRIKMGGSTTNAKADQWFSVRVIVNAAAKTLSLYYSINGGETYSSPNSNWVDKTSTQVDLSKITSVGFKANTYREEGEGMSLSYNTYVDNVELYKTDCFSFTANNKEWNYCSEISVDGDHICDGCGAELNCEIMDKNLDGRCDVCGIRGFGADITNDLEDIDVSYVLSNSTNSVNSGIVTPESCQSYNEITASQRPDGYGRGTLYSLVDDPTTAASNTVLSINVSNPAKSGATQNLVNYIKITPDGDANARFLMLEADFYAVSVDASKNIFHFTAFGDDFDPLVSQKGITDTSKTVTGMGFQRVSILAPKCTSASAVTLSIGGTSTTAKTLQWVSVKFILDTVENVYYIYYSVDGGNTFTAIKTASAPPVTYGITRLPDYSKVQYMGIETDTYGVTGGQAYVDNLRVVRVNTIQFGTVTLGSAE